MQIRNQHSEVYTILIPKEESAERMQVTAEPFSSFLETKRIFSGKRSQGCEGAKRPRGSLAGFTELFPDFRELCTCLQRFAGCMSNDGKGQMKHTVA